MPVVVHATIKYFIEESPLEVGANVESQPIQVMQLL